MLGPEALTTHLADLGADVIQVEPPQGDYGRRMTLADRRGCLTAVPPHQRGKRSIVLDLRTEAGCDAFRELVRDADAVVEAMRPGSLDRQARIRAAARSAKIVFVTISGYGMTGPYRDMPSHGAYAYDVWAGLVQPAVSEGGFPYMPEHPSVGIHAGPLFGALVVCLAGVVRARDR